MLDHICIAFCLQMNVFMNEVICPLESRAEQEVNMSKVRNCKIGFLECEKMNMYPDI